MQQINNKFSISLMLFCAVSLGTAMNALAVEPLSTSYNQVLIGGQAKSIAGNSLFWSNNGWGGEKYYNTGVVNSLKQDWNSSLVRAAMGVEDSGGYLQFKNDNKNKVKAVVDAAIANDMYVIIDWHSHHAEQHQQEAIAFFQEMASLYGQYDNVIYEIYNEPLNVSWSNTIKPYAEAVISAIRSVDPDNLIVVGTPNWAQDVDIASYDPITGFNNIAYTLHFYAGTHKSGLRSKAQTALNNGIPLFVTEWGTVNANGDGGVDYGETDAWMSFLKDNNISHANWSINDKAEGSSALYSDADAQGNWSSGDLTDSGNKVKEILQSWSGGTVPGGQDCTSVGLPSRVQAESWCNMMGVENENAYDEDGTQSIGYLDVGDWATYDVSVPQVGTYNVTYRVASLTGDGTIQLEKSGGGIVYGTVDVQSTGDWYNWTTVSHEVDLPQGELSLALVTNESGYNLNWFEVTPVSTNPVGDYSVSVQAENYTAMSGVVNGGDTVGYLDAGDWVTYASVDIPRSGTYTIEYHVASALSSGVIQFEQAGGAVQYNTINVPDTGGWNDFTTIKHQVNLPAGSQSFALSVISGGWNIDWFTIREGVH